ncbi:MAG TPA: DedA family protein [Tepidisphaeraceae bacterium]|nr:DedA family protein [Tepidisphaeraceae bacterium]
MELVRKFIDIFLHLDKTLDTYGNAMGGWLYVVLFAILFCETGLVVTPFLPGDSLLFAVGALIGTGVLKIDMTLAMVIMAAAAVLGDAVNYSIGARIGPKVFSREDSWLLNKKHLQQAHDFYDRYGGKTIILARFIPVIRTFAPFVAGIGKMSYPRFALYNITGGVAWVILLTLCGRFFGQIEFVKKHFEIVIFAIIIISVLPAVYEFWKNHREAKRAKALPTSVASSGTSGADQ